MEREKKRVWEETVKPNDARKKWLEETCRKEWEQSMETEEMNRKRQWEGDRKTEDEAKEQLEVLWTQ